MTDAAAASTFDPRLPFTRGQALAAGVPRRSLYGPAYRQLHTGIFVSAVVDPDPLLLAHAALLPFDADAHASHATAARVWRLPIPVLPDEHVTVADRKQRRSRAGIRCHWTSRRDVVSEKGIRVSSLPQTFVELGTVLHLVDLVVVGDHLARRCDIAPSQLTAFCSESRHAGAGRALEAARLVRERVDSPMESRTRMLIVLAGLPEPEVNPTILADDGFTVRRYDLCYRRSRTIVEYEGRQHVEIVRQWEQDVTRRAGIDDDAWRSILLIAKDIYSTPGETVERIQRVLLERGEPGVPKRLSDRWRRYFPERGT